VWLIVLKLSITAVIFIQSLKLGDPAIRLGAESNPRTGHDVTEKKSGREKHNQLEHIAALFCDCALHQSIDELLKRREHLADVGEAKEFE